MKNPKVIIYTTADCSFCHALMDCLEEDGVDFEEKDLTNPADRKKAEEKLGHEIKTVPITLVGDVEIIGFKRAAIRKALKKLSA